MDCTIAMPLRDKPERETRYALEHHLDGFDVRIETVVGLPVVEARNLLTQRLRGLQPRPDVVVWVDGDGFWLPGTFERIVTQAHELQAVVVGYCGAQQEMAFDVFGQHADGRDFTVDMMRTPALYPCRRIALAMCAMPTSFLDRIGGDPWTITLPTVDEFGGDPWESTLRLCRADFHEDHAFSTRLFDAGLPMYLDTRAPVWQALKGFLFLPGCLAAHLYRGELHFETTLTIGDHLLRERHGTTEGALYGVGFNEQHRRCFAALCKAGGREFVATMNAIAAAISEREANGLTVPTYAAIKLLERTGERITVDAVAAKLETSVDTISTTLVQLLRAGFVQVVNGSIRTTRRTLAA